MDAADYLTMLRRYWRSLALLTLAGGVVGLVLALLLPTTYSSTAKVLFVGTDGPTVQLAVLTYADLVKTDEVLQPVVDQVDGAGDTEDVADLVSVGSSASSQVIVIEVTDTDRELTSEIANAVAASLVSQTAEAEEQVSDEPVTRGKVVEAAKPRGKRDGPSRQGYAVGGALAGLLLGLAQALARFFRHRRDDA